MKIQRTNWKHLAIGYPIAFSVLYLLVYLIKCIGD